MAKKSQSVKTARVRGFIILIVIAVLLFTSIAPIRQVLDQRAEIVRLELTLENLKTVNKSLSIETERLNTDAYIEQQARLRLGLIKPGEEPYMIVPPKQTPPPAVKPAPKPVTEPAPKTWWQDAIDYVASLFK